jgi:hypothetical protein
MQDFTRILDMIDYVDGLNKDTKFDYANHNYCLLGLGILSPSIPNEVKLSYLSYGNFDEFCRGMGITIDQCNILYEKLMPTMYAAGRFDKKTICYLAYTKVLKWQEEQCVSVINKYYDCAWKCTEEENAVA